jgi:hypothetical protein
MTQMIRYTYDEAEREPWMTLDHMSAVVAAVVAPADNPLVALHLLPKCVLAEREDKAHLDSSTLCFVSWCQTPADIERASRRSDRVVF